MLSSDTLPVLTAFLSHKCSWLVRTIALAIRVILTRNKFWLHFKNCEERLIRTRIVRSFKFRRLYKISLDLEGSNTVGNASRVTRCAVLFRRHLVQCLLYVKLFRVVNGS